MLKQSLCSLFGELPKDSQGLVAVLLGLFRAVSCLNCSLSGCADCFSVVASPFLECYSKAVESFAPSSR